MSLLSLILDFFMVFLFIRLFRLFVTFKVYRIKERGGDLDYKIKLFIGWTLFMLLLYSIILIIDVVMSIYIVQNKIQDSKQFHKYLAFSNMILPSTYFLIGMSLLHLFKSQG